MTPARKREPRDQWRDLDERQIERCRCIKPRPDCFHFEHCAWSQARRNR